MTGATRADWGEVPSADGLSSTGLLVFDSFPIEPQKVSFTQEDSIIGTSYPFVFLPPVFAVCHNRAFR